MKADGGGSDMKAGGGEGGVYGGKVKKKRHGFATDILKKRKIMLKQACLLYLEKDNG